MGLLDMFNTDEGRFGLSLLAAAAPTTQPMGFGQRLAGAMQLQDQWKQSQADRQLQQQEAEWLRTQRDRKAKTWAMEDQAAQAQAVKRAAIPSLFSQDGSGGLSGFNVARALELGLGPEEIDKWSKIPNAGRAKVARTIEGRDEQGRPVTYQVDEFGQRVGDALEQWKAPMLINQGDRQTLLDPGTRQTLGSLSMNMSQAERDASARGWAANALARERLAFDMNGGAEAGKPQYKDGQWVMPPRNMQPGQAIPAMPSTAAKEANEALALIRQAEQIIPKATGSYLGSATDTAARAFGISTKGDMATGQLQALEGALVSKMPKMSGPQSDKDVQLYRQMAGVIGDPTIPTARKLAALETIKEIQIRYAGPQPTPMLPKPGQMGSGSFGMQPAAPGGFRIIGVQ